MKNNTRPPVSSESIPNLPWGHEPGKYDACFVLGLANKTWPPKDQTKIAYKIVRWHRYFISNESRKTLEQGMPKNIQDFIDKSVESIRNEKKKGKLASVEKIAIVYDFFGVNQWTVIDL